MDFEEETTVCTICHENKSKYTCPACEIKTCSLSCYNKHKYERDCTGKVDSNKYLNRNELAADPVHLNRDYNFLNNVDRKIHVGKEDIVKSAKNVFKRTRNQSQASGNKRYKRNEEDNTDKRITAVKKIFSNDPNISIKRENILIVSLPIGMSRSNTNKTGFDKKLNSFVWTIEWIMLNEQGEQVTKFISYRLKESLVLQDSVPMNIINNKFTKPVEKCYLKFYLHDVIHKDKMIRLNGGDKISDVLKDKIVLEYPTIYVAANDECLQDRIIDSLQLAEEEEDDTTDSSEDDSSDSESDDDDSDSGSETSSIGDGSGEDNDSDSAPEETSSKLPPFSQKFFEASAEPKPIIEEIGSNKTVEEP
ncbi:hypothetical protein MGE_02107 [Candida albicans P75010]|nr:hypothetical protein MGE_02107 [Candida albicans P75010]